MIISRWHSWIGQPKFDEAWHRQDMDDEWQEYQEARGLVHKWSELSDVAYTYTRAAWSGHKLDFPLRRGWLYVGYMYMLPKYTSRSEFFKRAGKKAGAKTTLRSVRNPRKSHKLHQIAEANQLPVDRFEAVCKKQLKYWPLLP